MKLEQAQAMAEAVTPRDELPRVAYGSLIFGPPNPVGLCHEAKCIKREGHTGSCWPK